MAELGFFIFGFSEVITDMGIAQSLVGWFLYVQVS